MADKNRYKNEIKEYKKKRRKDLKYAIAHKLGLHFHWLKDMQVKKIVEKNLLPDVSTITFHIAFVLDNEVVEIMHCQERLAAILLSNPTIVKLDSDSKVKVGDTYNG